jgi:AcrR family transcriptional regulator
MARPQTHSRKEFIDAAIEIADKEGLEGLTLRRLGTELNVSYTAIYTYFKNRDDLLAALVERLSREIVEGTSPTGTSAREVILAVGLSTRRTLAKRPRLIPVFAQGGTDGSDGAADAMLSIVTMLEDAGLRGEQLTSAYRSIESYIVGSTVFDFGAAPNHVKLRRERYKQSGHPDFIAVAKSDKSTSAHNEAAFVAGLEHLLVAFGL